MHASCYTMTMDAEVRRRRSALAHDVGKYIARTALNLRSMDDAALASLSDVLLQMLLRDLYGDGEEVSPEARYRAGRDALSVESAEVIDACFASLEDLRAGLVARGEGFASDLRQAIKVAMQIRERLDAECQ